VTWQGDLVTYFEHMKSVRCCISVQVWTVHLYQLFICMLCRLHWCWRGDWCVQRSRCLTGSFWGIAAYQAVMLWGVFVVCSH